MSYALVIFKHTINQTTETLLKFALNCHQTFFIDIKRTFHAILFVVFIQNINLSQFIADS